ncbi:hypothetical protein D1227_06480 [Henriciella mobilis]|uniref:hypothetical protein n=1 Tax=Henriciella mobilis TaxID=2305467 RepID=UPI000E67375D|nr:hypothetical protein [Henriciella mobilis]RIJ15943.1 hypothetical protein D1231_09120 [Henriciella mobilis]RIJ21153.1 hypothetical protein D1227_12660 [Henriciella mobilis]RIJ23146.1 hypothetical protein D1227_06480 [Henriciella mobilis]
MLGIFKKKRVRGDIALLGLEHWWFETFTEEDRQWMADTYAPMGATARPLIEGRPYTPRPHPFVYLSNAAVWFNKEGYRHCAYAFIDKAYESPVDDVNVLDLHFAYMNHCQVFYRWRDEDEAALSRAIAACERSIEINERAAQEWKQQYGDPVPAHHCFKQLAIIEEKRGDFDRAIDLCEAAISSGWNGDWQKRVERLNKKKHRPR